MYASTKCKEGWLLWLRNPEETSPEVQNRGISDPIKSTDVLQKYLSIDVSRCRTRG